MYVIKRTDRGGGFVSKPGSAKSYTHNLRKAQIFATKEAALAQCCQGNEIPVNRRPWRNAARATKSRLILATY